MIFAKADDFENLAQPLEAFARKFKSKVISRNLNLKGHMDLVILFNGLIIFLTAYVYICGYYK